MVRSAQNLGYREVVFRVSQPCPRLGMSLRILPWLPIAISAETYLTSQFPGGAVIVRYIQRGSVELDPLRIGFW